jgi:hyperosmotically inducible protein
MSTKRKLALVMLLASALALGGCVVVIGDEGVHSDGAALRLGDERASRGDAALAESVRSALFAEPLLRDVDITVSAHDGVITLKGEVSGLPAIERALQVARGTAGVEQVVSKIRVVLR